MRSQGNGVLGERTVYEFHGGNVESTYLSAVAAEVGAHHLTVGPGFGGVHEGDYDSAIPVDFASVLDGGDGQIAHLRGR